MIIAEERVALWRSESLQWLQIGLRLLFRSLKWNDGRVAWSPWDNTETRLWTPKMDLRRASDFEAERVYEELLKHGQIPPPAKEKTPEIREPRPKRSQQGGNAAQTAISPV